MRCETRLFCLSMPEYEREVSALTDDGHDAAAMSSVYNLLIIRCLSVFRARARTTLQNKIFRKIIIAAEYPNNTETFLRSR